MNILPYTELIPKTVKMYKDRMDWGMQNPNSAPTNPNAPLQYWADTTLSQAVGQSTTAAFDPWAQFMVGSRQYNFIARDASGKPKLCPIDSHQFHDTYGAYDALVRTYREFAFCFPFGVPFLEQVIVPASEAGTVNVEGGNGQVRDYPIEMRPDMLLVVDRGEVATVQYQSFAASTRRVARSSNAEKVALILDICVGKQTPDDKMGAIRVIAQRQ